VTALLDDLRTATKTTPEPKSDTERLAQEAAYLAATHPAIALRQK